MNPFIIKDLILAFTNEIVYVLSKKRSMIISMGPLAKMIGISSGMLWPKTIHSDWSTLWNVGISVWPLKKPDFSSPAHALP